MGQPFLDALKFWLPEILAYFRQMHYQLAVRQLQAYAQLSPGRFDGQEGAMLRLSMLIRALSKVSARCSITTCQSRRSDIFTPHAPAVLILSTVSEQTLYGIK